LFDELGTAMEAWSDVGVARAQVTPLVVLKKSPKYAGVRALPAKNVNERFRRPKLGAN
jgi:hypothetical protein